jgi:hypothetical protein
MKKKQYYFIFDDISQSYLVRFTGGGVTLHPPPISRWDWMRRQYEFDLKRARAIIRLGKDLNWQAVEVNGNIPKMALRIKKRLD